MSGLTPTGSNQTFAGVGRLEFSPTTTADDPFPVWVDITSRVRTESEPLSLETMGSQSELDTGESCVLSATLDDSDGALTYGLTSGPFGTGWVPSRRFRYSETWGNRTFVLYSGYMEFPDIDDFKPIGYQEVKLVCNDGLTRLARGRPFVSTLGAHVLFNGPANGMQAFWPLGEASTPFLDVSTNAVGAFPLESSTLPNLVPTTAGPLFSFQGAPAIFADDLNCLQLSPALAGTSDFQTAFLQTQNSNFSVSNGTMTFTFWMWFNDITTSSIFMVNNTSATTAIGMSRSVGQWQVTGIVGASTVAFNINPPPTQKWTLCSIRLTLPSGLVEYWQDDDPPQTGTLSGSPASSTTITSLGLGSDFVGYLGHVQLYSGPTATAFPRAAHLAQFQMAQTGLEYQSTGQRVNTILDYAGVPALMRVVDPGVAFMQVATLAGQDPLTALRNAVDTEVGRGFVDGYGRYVFQDRTHVLNV